MTHIEELQENIRRLKVTITKTDTYQEGYLKTCRKQLAAYEKRLAELNDELRPRYYAVVGHADGDDDEAIIFPDPMTRDEAIAKAKVSLNPDNEHPDEDIYITAAIASDSPLTQVNTWAY